LAVRFACLGSGSSGNGLVVESGGTRVLLDCGFPLKETELRLARLRLAGHDLCAVLVTHEHTDHMQGVARFALKFRLPVYMTYGAWRVFAAQGERRLEVRVIGSEESLAVESLEIQPFPVPHDAQEPVQYVFGDGIRKLGVLTDCGSVTTHIAAVLSGLHALVLECNHDVEMLTNGEYPPALKARILGRYGHLDNQTAAGLLARMEVGRLQHIIAAHLSEKNNRPELARAALAGALNCQEDWIGVAGQEQGFGWRQIV
jgi:phosphoribosyl 1,2-cyclic phosphodiesterase